MLKFNDVYLTNDTIQKTRKWFSDNALVCIEEANTFMFLHFYNVPILFKLEKVFLCFQFE